MAIVLDLSKLNSIDTLPNKGIVLIKEVGNYDIKVDIHPRQSDCFIEYTPGDWLICEIDRYHLDLKQMDLCVNDLVGMFRVDECIDLEKYGDVPLNGRIEQNKPVLHSIIKLNSNVFKEFDNDDDLLASVGFLCLSDVAGWLPVTDELLKVIKNNKHYLSYKDELVG